MKWNFAGFGLLALLAVELPPAPADACGVKLTVKSSGPRKTAARSSHPSRVLLLGSPPRRLERDLAAAGHDVEVAPEPGSAQKASYAGVIADSNAQADAAREEYEAVVSRVRQMGELNANASGDVCTCRARAVINSTEGRSGVAWHVGSLGFISHFPVSDWQSAMRHPEIIAQCEARS